jgi:competence protein ComEC
MPPVAHLAIAFAAGLLAGRVAPGPWWTPALVALPSLGLARRATWGAVVVLACGVGLAYGKLVGAREAASCATTWSRGRHAAIVRLGDAPDGRGLADAGVRHAPERCAGRIRLRLGAGAIPSGATLVVVGQHQPGAALRVERYRVLGVRPAPRFRIRDAVARRIASLYGPRAPIVDALVLGRRGDIDPELRAEFVAAGLAHLLAISGLHVGIIAAWIAVLGRTLGLGPRAAWLSAAGAWGYVLLLGFPAPATRAATFVAIGAVARGRQRHPRSGAVLAVAVLVVLAVDPNAASQAGAWLSVAAVWGTAEAGAVLRRMRRPHPAVRLLAASVGAVLATAPITARVFGQVSLAGVVTNLVAVPIAGVTVPGVLASLLGGGLLAGGAGLTLAALERVAALGARIPFGVIGGDPGLAFAVPWVGVLAVGLWLARRRPTWPVAARRAAAVLAVAVWAGLARDVWTRDRYDGLTLYILDVGQGDAIALRSPRGRWMLVDAGPRIGGRDAGRTVVAPFLRRQGVRALDLLVVTHGDADHSGGAPSVLAAVPAATVLEPGQPLGSAPYLEFLAAVDAAGAAWHPARAGDVIEWDGVWLEVLHPSERWLQREVRANENSVVLRVTFGAFDALLTGDAGLPVESTLLDLVSQVEVLKIGHHGSAGSTGEPFLAAAAPKVALISVGENGYGHPAAAVMTRLAEGGIPSYRTDQGGTVTVRSDGMYFEVRQTSSPTRLPRFLCPNRDSSRSKASSSSRNACSPKPPGSSPTSYTTWPSRPR